MSASCRAGEPDESRTDEDRERLAIEAIAAKAGLRSFGTTRSPHYLAIGDAIDPLRSATLRDCEAVAAEYLDFYQSRGFKVTMPAGRFIVVTLANERSRSAFDAASHGHKSPIEANRHLVHPGHYEPYTNRVVINMRANAPRSSEAVNTPLLAHEATHQLAFNTGLLNRRGDVPRAIGEGLAEFGKVSTSAGRDTRQELLLQSLHSLVSARRSGTPWYPVDQLIADDRPFLLNSFVRRQHLAYAQAWLLIDYFMKDRSRLKGFQAYFQAIWPRTDGEHRLDDAEKHLGDLDRLDHELLAYFLKVNKSV